MMTVITHNAFRHHQAVFVHCFVSRCFILTILGMSVLPAVHASCHMWPTCTCSPVQGAIVFTAIDIPTMLDCRFASCWTLRPPSAWRPRLHWRRHSVHSQQLRPRHLSSWPSCGVNLTAEMSASASWRRNCVVHTAASAEQLCGQAWQLQQLVMLRVCV
jgi:hypothetical protein